MELAIVMLRAVHGKILANPKVDRARNYASVARANAKLTPSFVACQWAILVFDVASIEVSRKKSRLEHLLFADRDMGCAIGTVLPAFPEKLGSNGNEVRIGYDGLRWEVGT
jgi:hypothetical protein